MFRVPLEAFVECSFAFHSAKLLIATLGRLKEVRKGTGHPISYANDPVKVYALTVTPIHRTKYETICSTVQIFCHKEPSLRPKTVTLL